MDIYPALLRCAPAALFILLTSAITTGFSQSNSSLEKFFKDNVVLSQDEIGQIRGGQAVAKALPSRTPAEVLLFGAIYIHAAPEKYFQFAEDIERRRKLSGYLALGVLSNPPRLADFKGFSLDADDIQALKNCKAGDCLIQMPANAIEEFQKSVDWSANDLTEQVNRRLQEAALERMSVYQREGNPSLGFYNDKRDPVEVPRELEYLLSYTRILPARLPDFYGYLLTYPRGKPANVDDMLYWERVKFGLKPTLRIVHRAIMRGSNAGDIPYAIAEKQLYASHYFETALDLTFCVRPTQPANAPGFFLIMLMGSEQAGLTGVKGSVIRKIAVGRSVSNLQEELTTIKGIVEAGN